MADPWITEGKAPKIPPITIFGHFLKMRRARLRIPQRTLAEAFGETYSFQDVERGERTMPAAKLEVVADIIKVDLTLLKEIYALDLLMRNRQILASQMK